MALMWQWRVRGLPPAGGCSPGSSESARGSASEARIRPRRTNSAARCLASCPAPTRRFAQSRTPITPSSSIPRLPRQSRLWPPGPAGNSSGAIYYDGAYDVQSSLINGESPQMADVLVAGAINTDLVARVPRAPEAGETVTGSSFNIFGGGKGANQTLASVRSGAATAILGSLGRDDFGSQRISGLARRRR